MKRNESLIKKLLENEEQMDQKTSNVQIRSSLNISRAQDVDHLIEGRNTFSQKFIDGQQTIHKYQNKMD